MKYFSYNCILCLISIHLISCSSSELISAVNETQANEIISVLAEQGIVAEKSRQNGMGDGNWKIVVNLADTTRAWSIIRENGLPRQQQKGLSETFSKTSIIPTPTEERAKMMQAVTGELEKSLGTIDGVMVARVHLVIPAAADWDTSAKVKTNAAVLLKVRPGSSVDKASVKRIVAGAVEGLSEGTVAVELFEGTSFPAAGGAIFRKVGPLYVHKSSITTLKIILIIGAIIPLAFGILTTITILKSGGSRTAGKEEETDDAAGE